MKSLIIKLAIPLTIISLASLEKWWYAIPIDGPDTLLYGFPLPFMSEAWHTSMALQFFGIEFLIDLLFYFVFWLISVYCIHRFVIKIQMPKFLTSGLWTFAGIILFGATLFASDSNNLFYVKRPFEMDLLETGYQFSWQKTERPNSLNYQRRSNKN